MKEKLISALIAVSFKYAMLIGASYMVHKQHYARAILAAGMFLISLSDEHRKR